MTTLFAPPSTIQLRLPTGDAIAGTADQCLSLLGKNQLGITFNDDGLAIDFGIKSLNNPNMFFLDGSANRIGMGTLLPTDGILHIQSGSAGAVSADATADELVLEGSAATGMTILAGASSDCNIFFGDSIGGAITGRIQYRNATDDLLFTASGIPVLSMSNSPGFVWNETGVATQDFRVESDLNPNMIFVDAGNNSVHIDNSLLTGAGDGDLVMANNKQLRWVNVAGTTSLNAEIGIDASDNMLFSVPAIADSYFFAFVGTGRIAIQENFGGGGILIQNESSFDHNAPSGTGFVFYSKDVGGKTAAFIRFPTGAVQQIAIEP